MWYLEYNWMLNAYQPRFEGIFTDIRGWRSFDTMDDAKAVLASIGWRVGKKTDSRTWRIETA